MSDRLIDNAIKASLSSNWQEAIKINRKILCQNSKDTNALNRLACAFTKTGNFQKATATYQKVLKINPYCAIAKKNIKRIQSVKNFKKTPFKLSKTPPICLDDLFLNKPGKTKIISLINLAPFEILSSLIPSQKLKIAIKKRSITLLTSEGNYIGALPDDLSYHLIKLTNGGNIYEANIHSIKKNNLSVVFREIKRDSKFKNQPSFV